jgi:hypothetical protein
MRKLPRIADKKQLHDAARVAVGVCLLTSVGIIAWTYGSKQGLPYLEQAAQGLQWGAITVLLVSYPVVGRTARTGVERALGTIAGTANNTLAAHHQSSATGVPAQAHQPTFCPVSQVAC